MSSLHFLQDVSVILIVPDYPDTLYIRDMTTLLLVQLGFRKISVQQVRIFDKLSST